MAKATDDCPFRNNNGKWEFSITALLGGKIRIKDEAQQHGLTTTLVINKNGAIEIVTTEVPPVFKKENEVPRKDLESFETLKRRGEDILHGEDEETNDLMKIQKLKASAVLAEVPGFSEKIPKKMRQATMAHAREIVYLKDQLLVGSRLVSEFESEGILSKRHENLVKNLKLFTENLQGILGERHGMAKETYAQKAYAGIDPAYHRIIKGIVNDKKFIMKSLFNSMTEDVEVAARDPLVLIAVAYEKEQYEEKDENAKASISQKQAHLERVTKEGRKISSNSVFTHPRRVADKAAYLTKPATNVITSMYREITCLALGKLDPSYGNPYDIIGDDKDYSTITDPAARNDAKFMSLLEGLGDISQYIVRKSLLYKLGFLETEPKKKLLKDEVQKMRAEISASYQKNAVLLTDPETKAFAKLFKKSWLDSQITDFHRYFIDDEEDLEKDREKSDNKKSKNKKKGSNNPYFHQGISNYTMEDRDYISKFLQEAKAAGVPEAAIKTIFRFVGKISHYPLRIKAQSLTFSMLVSIGMDSIFDD